MMGAALILAAALAVIGLFSPEPVESVAAIGCVTVLIAAPVLRVLWLTIGWVTSGDRRFAVVGGGLLSVLAVGAIAALILR